jgi:putative ABC transport system permease protein
VTSERIYRALLRVLPRRTRQDAEEELVDIFLTRLRRASGEGARAVRQLWCYALADLAVAAVAERVPVRSGGMRRTHMGSGLKRMTIDSWLSLRSIGRSPGAPALSVLTLAMGLAASLVAFVVVRDVLIRPLPFPDPDRLVRLTEVDARGGNWWPSYPNCVDWRREATQLFDRLGCADAESLQPVIVGSQAVKVPYARASGGFFEALGVRPVAGRLFSQDENRIGGSPAALVSYRFWRDVLGSRPIDGLSVTVGSASSPVVGVLPRDFAFIGSIGAWSVIDVWTPMDRDTDLGQRSSHGYHTIGRLRQGVTLERARAEMATLSTALKAEHKEPTQADSVGLRPLKDFVTRTAVVPMRVLTWAAGAVLLVSCLNFAASILARGLARQRELRLRLALGATRRDLLRLLLADAIAMAVPAIGIGILAATLGLSWLRVAAALSVPRIATVSFDWSAAAIAVAAAFACGLISAVLPALSLSSRALSAGLGVRGASDGSRSTQRLWSFFVAMQVAVTLVLLCESGLLLKSFGAASSVDLGYRTDRVIAVDLTLPETTYRGRDARVAFFRTVEDRVRQLRGVESVGLTNILPNDSQSMTANTDVPGRTPHDGMVFTGYRIVDQGYFDVIGLPVRVRSDSLAADRAYVDERVVAKLWPSTSPIGDRVHSGFSNGDLNIAGVVGAARQWDEEDGGVGAIYVPFGDTPGVPFRMSLVAVYHGSLADARMAIRSAVAAVDPLVPSDAQWLETLTAESLQSRRVLTTMAMAFAGIAFVLASVGTYAMVVFAVRRRTREAAIRLALGANAAQVRRRFFRAGMFPAVMGLVAGALAAPAAGRLVGAQLFRVKPNDPVVLAVAIVALMAAAIAAAAVPARRASRVDPVTLLRDE